jgi:hypothetical protein
MHAQWTTLLDDEFVAAWQSGTYTNLLSGQLTVNVRVMAGFVVRCGDNLEWRVYPRIFTYSADYPEKYVLYRIS